MTKNQILQRLAVTKKTILLARHEKFNIQLNPQVRQAKMLLAELIDDLETQNIKEVNIYELPLLRESRVEA